jgi:hypothetical protein
MQNDFAEVRADAPLADAPRVEVSAEWVLNQYRHQQEVNAELMGALQDLRKSLRTPGLSEAMSRPIPAVVVTEPASSSQRKAKHSLSHPDKYDGVNKAAYPAFKGHLRAKLRIDRGAIGDEPEQVWYAFGRLSDKASERMFPWIETIERKGDALTTDAFFAQLDAAFYNEQIPQRALEWINTRKQGNTPFRDFLQTFEQKLLEAGGWDFSDGVRKGYLRAALSLELITQLVGKEEPAKYSDFVAIIRRVSDDLDTIKRIKRHRSGGGTTAPTREEAAPIEVMDWEPAIQVAATGNLANRGRVGTDSRPRAKWVSQETLEQRRENRQCLRCGRDDHFISKCGYAPARQPTDGRPRRRTAVTSKSTTQEAPAKNKSKTKRPPTPARVAEVQNKSEYSLSSDSENE